MEKFISPRGSGRTTQICKYAIENDCDIIVPTINQFDHTVNTIQKIYSSSDGELIYCGVDVDKHTATVDIAVWNGRRQIKIYDAGDFTVRYFWRSTKPVVIDDIDECMKHIQAILEHLNIQALYPLMIQSRLLDINFLVGIVQNETLIYMTSRWIALMQKQAR